LIPGASTTFVDDASTNNFAVTIAGDTKPNSFNPYTPGYYSVQFNGSSSIGTFTGPTIGTGDYTIEFWIYHSSVASDQDYYQTYSGSSLNILLEYDAAAQKVRHVLRNDSGTSNFDFNSGSGLVVNTWNHLAFVLSGSTAYTFINGNCTTLGATVSATGTRSGTYTNTLLGALFSGARFLNGNMSNFRFVKGTALYTSNFTPSTIPLTAVSGTALLLCQSNRFVDNSTNNYSLGTIASGLQIKSFQPFVPNTGYSSYGSAYFDGTGDYLTLTSNSALAMGTDQYTVEFWIYFNSLASQPNEIFRTSTDSASGRLTIYYNAGSLQLTATGGAGATTASYTFNINQWYHVAGTRDSSNNQRLFVNGVLLATTTSTNNYSQSGLTMGRDQAGSNYINGYISDFRLVKGTAVYTSAFTPPSAPLTAIANTSLLTLQNNQPVNNNVFLDNSTNNFFVTRNGNTTQGTFSPYGGNWSNYFDGTGDMLQTPSITIGTNAFCFECWLYPTVTQGTTTGIFVGSTTDSLQASYYGNPGLGIATKGTAWQLYEETTLPTVNAWNHVAFVRSGTGTNQTSIYINGVRVANGTVASNFAASVYQISTTNAGGSVFQGYISNARLTNGSTPYDATQSTITVPTTPLTPITNTVLLTCADNRLIDDSPNNFTITKNGDVSIQRFSPFNPSSVTPTSYSGYFDGTGDYLTVPITTNATADLTFECWFYATGYGSLDYGTIIGAGVGTGIFQLQLYNASNPNRILGYVGSTSGVGNLSPTLSQPVLNRWIHLAVVRSGSTFTMYENGVSVATATNSNSMNFGTVTQLGAAGSSYTFQGYISNLRLVIGTAVYTSNFTPSTSPLTAISGTSLLTCQSTTFIDNSTNNFTITAVGNSQPRQQNPFGYTSTTTNGYTPSTIGGSGYYDGSGDSIASPQSATFNLSSGNWTIEAWYYSFSVLGQSARYLTITPSSGIIYGVLPGSGGFILNQFGSSSPISTSITATLNAWQHIALVKNGSTTTLYINGVAGGSGTPSWVNADTTIFFGGNTGSYAYDYSGYISDARVVKGTALYTSNFVPPAQPLTSVQNTSFLLNYTSAGIYNATMMTTMETVGDAKLSTAISKFGGSSMVFDGTGDYLSIPINPSLIFGTGDFTVETWVYLPSVSGYFGVVGMGSSGFFVQISNGNNIHVSQADVVDLADFAISPTLSANTWYHFAMTRSGTSMKAFINGIQQGSTVTNSTNFTGTNAVLVGGHPGGIILYSGYMDDLRITKGYARYTSNFTPPTSALQIK